MKTVYAMIGLVGFYSSVTVLGVSDRVHCTVQSIEPAGASFFNPTLSRPRKGDTIDLDFSADEITDLTFSSGASIPLKQANAKLVKQVTGEEPYLTYYEGTHKSTTSDYIGVLHVARGDDVAIASFELLRKEFFHGMSLHKMQMQCDLK